MQNKPPSEPITGPFCVPELPRSTLMTAPEFWTDFKSQKSDRERLRACLRFISSQGLGWGLLEDKRYTELMLGSEGD